MKKTGWRKGLAKAARTYLARYGTRTERQLYRRHINRDLGLLWTEKP